jgi:hypothetical protein
LRLATNSTTSNILSSRPEQPAFSGAPFLRAGCGADGPWLDPYSSRIVVIALLTLAYVALIPSTRAEYIVLRSGQRLTVTGYQLNGDTYRLQLDGGYAEILATEVVSIEPEEVFTPLPHVDAAKAPFRDQILAAASRYSVDPDLIASIIAAESNFDPKAISRRNARGLMQLLPQTASRFGVKNILDPEENINAGTHFLSDLLKRYNNNLALTLAAYNAGPETVQRYGRRVPPYRETQTYVQKIRRTYAQRKSAPPSPIKPANTPPAAPPTSADATPPAG